MEINKQKQLNINEKRTLETLESFQFCEKQLPSLKDSISKED